MSENCGLAQTGETVEGVWNGGGGFADRAGGIPHLFLGQVKLSSGSQLVGRGRAIEYSRRMSIFPLFRCQVVIDLKSNFY